MTALHPDALALIRELLTIWVFQFSVATLIVYMVKGRKALQWSHSLVRSARVNWSFVATNLLAGPFLMLVAISMNKLISDWGIPRLPSDLWASVPVAVQIPVAIILIDFIEYWEHRIKHKSFLWPLHAVHHSDTELNYMSWQRLHVVDAFLHHVLFVLLGTLLGLHYTSIALFVVARGLHQQYVHMNIDRTHGWLELLIASPRFHRWHHADIPAAYDKNFSLTIPLWDYMFGTYYCPGPCEEETGFEGNPGDNFVQLLIYPFQEWGKMIKRRVGSSDVPGVGT